MAQRGSDRVDDGSPLSASAWHPPTRDQTARGSECLASRRRRSDPNLLGEAGQTPGGELSCNAADSVRQRREDIYREASLSKRCNQISH